MAVVTPDGLVGKTVDVSLRTADVLLLSDPNCKVSARIARTGTFGLVSGTGPARDGAMLCRMEFINKDVPIRAGDQVLTSGLGGVFPPGLLVGYVDAVDLDESGLYQRADVVPRADLGRLTYVFVVFEEEDPIEEWLRKRDLSRGRSE
jgi:rod shape-determining protein MreC